MKKIVNLIFAAAVLLSIIASAMPLQAETAPWSKKIASIYCKPRYVQDGWGCDAYIQYRFKYQMTKTKAHSTCHWACNKVGYGAKCKEGCDQNKAWDK